MQWLVICSGGALGALLAATLLRRGEQGGDTFRTIAFNCLICFLAGAIAASRYTSFLPVGSLLGSGFLITAAPMASLIRSANETRPTDLWPTVRGFARSLLINSVYGLASAVLGYLTAFAVVSIVYKLTW